MKPVRLSTEVILVCGLFFFTAACAPSPAAGTEGSQEPSPTFTFPPAFPGTPTNTKFPTRTKPPAQTVTPTPTPLDLSPDTSILLDGFVPHGARARLGRGIINRIALSPDGKLLAVAGATGLSLFEADTVEEIWSVPTTMAMTHLAFSADGTRLTAFSLQQKYYGSPCACFISVLDQVHVWNVADHDLLRSIPLNYDFHSSWPVTVDLSLHGNFLAVSDPSTSRIDMWDLEAGRLRNSLPMDFGQSVAISEEGLYLAVGFRSLVSVFHAESATPIAQFQESFDVVDMAFSPDGKYLAVNVGYGIVLRDPETGFAMRTLESEEQIAPGWAFSAKGLTIAAVTSGGGITLWTCQTGSSTGIPVDIDYLKPDTFFFRNLIVHPEDGTVRIGTSDGVHVLDTASKEIRRSLKQPYSDWLDVVMKTGKVGVRELGGVWYFQGGDLHPLTSYSIPLDAVTSPGFDRYAISSAQRDILVSDLEIGSVLFSWKAPEYLDDFNDDTFFLSPDGRTAATKNLKVSTYPFKADFWNMANGKIIRRMDFPSWSWTNPCYLLFSPSGNLIAMGAYDGEYGEIIDVISLADGRKVGHLSFHGPFNFAFSHDSLRMATTCGSWEDYYNFCFYSTKDGSEIMRFKIPEDKGSVTRSVFSADDKRFAYGTASGYVFVFDAQSGKLTHSFQDHNDEIRKVAFYPDGTALASASADGTVVVWNLEG